MPSTSTFSISPLRLKLKHTKIVKKSKRFIAFMLAQHLDIYQKILDN